MFVCPDCGHSQPTAGPCPTDQTALAPRGDDALLGQPVGAYRIAKLLGVGGMGRVYKGVHPTIGSRVAVKVLSRECADRPDLVERFFSEARAVNLIRHESIVNVLDLAQLPDGRPYIIMEYLDGAPLADLVTRLAPMPLGGLARLIAEVLDALSAAHAKGIVHRDLKPDNIYVTPAGRPKVLDFGIAKLRPELGGSATQTGSLLGTPHYMSPEQALGKGVDLRTDIYAMGVILFECATGRRPFVAESLFDLLRRHVDEPPPPPRSLRPDMPPAMEQVILYALAKDPAHRYQSCADLAGALMQATAGLPQEQWAPLTPGSQSRMSAAHGPGSWGSQGTWPQSQPPPMMTPGPGSYPPGQPQQPPPGSVANAAGQMMQSPSHARPPKSNKPVLFALVGVALLGGGVAAALALGGGGDEEEQAQGGEPGVASGTEAGTAAPIAALPDPQVPPAGDPDDLEQQLELLEKQLETVDDAELEKAMGQLAQLQGGNPKPPPPPRPPAGGSDLVKKLNSFSTGIPACDAYVRVFVALIDCPALKDMRGAYETTAEQMMDGLSQIKKMDARTRRQNEGVYIQTCNQGADAMRSVATSMGCTLDPKLAATTAVAPPPPPDPPPPDDVRTDGPYDLRIAGFNPAGFDYMKWLPTAMKEARKHFPDAQLARIHAEGVGPDGLAHLSVAPDDFSVLYRFTSPAAGKKPASHPAGLKWEPRCMVQIIVEADETTVLPMQGFGCEPPVPMPKCDARQVWKQAIAKGAPASNAYAELWYGYAGGKWSFDIDEVFDDTFTDGC